MKSVAIAITTFMRPDRLERLLRNMIWAGWPDIKTYVTVDAPLEGWSPKHFDLMEQFKNVTCQFPIAKTTFMPEWGCMQGSIQSAMETSREDWIIYVPDDILFTKGALYNEYAGVLAYGEPFVGGIQAPYWNADELHDLGVMPDKKCMLGEWIPSGIPRNPHWDADGLPRSYVNLNGAGFSLNRDLWFKMGGWPRETWRLDEYAGLMAWKYDFVCLTLPGPVRVHYFGGATGDMPDGLGFHKEESWEKATGMSVQESGTFSRTLMNRWGGDGAEFPLLKRKAKEYMKKGSYHGLQA